MFNTNNIWVNLASVRERLPNMKMEVLANKKVVETVLEIKYCSLFTLYFQFPNPVASVHGPTRAPTRAVHWRCHSQLSRPCPGHPRPTHSFHAGQVHPRPVPNAILMSLQICR